jgi:hypothetical protein
MPTYAKFLKEILLNKRSLKDCKSVQLNFQCSAVVSRKLPPKLSDPGRFTIPCTIGKANIKKSLCDLGASVSLMPHTVFLRIGVGELRPTRLTLQLADGSARLPLGIVEDVPVQVGKFFIPCDFVVIDMEEDKEVPVILERPFLRTARTVFDTYEGTLTMKVGSETVKFKVDKAVQYPDLRDDCYRADGIDDLDELSSQVDTHAARKDTHAAHKHSKELSTDPAVGEVEIPTYEPKRMLCESHEVSTSHTPSLTDAMIVSPNVRSRSLERPIFRWDTIGCPTKHVKGPSPAGHTHADASLRYKSLDFDRSSLRMVSTNVNPDETSMILEKPRIYRGAIVHSIKNIKGLSPAIT